MNTTTQYLSGVKESLRHKFAYSTNVGWPHKSNMHNAWYSNLRVALEKEIKKNCLDNAKRISNP